jgi:hypothetical protein
MRSILTERLSAIDEHEQQIADWYVLLWSQRQNGFHIERVKQMLNLNRRAYAEDRCMDYVPLFIGLEDGCHDLAEKLRGTIRARNESRLTKASVVDGPGARQ